MPELPEVETVANGLHRRLAGDVIESVWLSDKRNILKSSPHEIVEVLEGSRIERSRRVGKHIVVDLVRESGAAGQWIIHLGMTGQVLVTTSDAELPKHTHLVATMRSGKVVRFVDPRRFGRLAVSTGDEFAGPGVEPLTVGEDEFAALFHKRNTPIKAALLNQKLLHGVGNIYADESLFRAGVRPKRKAASLTRDELARLRTALRAVLKQAIKAGGSSVSDYVDESGEKGSYQLRHNVYLRTGKPCRKCGAPIKRIIIGGRGTHYCPKCQK